MGMGSKLALDSMGLFGRISTSSLLNNLVSYYKLEEASGARSDAVVASGNDLTDNNTVTQNPGKIGQAAQFTNANSEWLSHVSNASLQVNNSDITLAGWVFLDSKAANRTIASKYGVVAGDREFVLYYESAIDKFACDVRGTTNEDEVQASNFGSPSLSTWYFVVFQHVNGVEIRISVNNGAFNTLAHTDGIQAGSADFTLGQFNAGNYMDGRIDEFGYWKRALTGTELTTLYNGGAGKQYPF